MEAPVTPQPNSRFKTMQTVTAPNGFVFEYCVDSYNNDSDVSKDLDAAKENIKELTN